MTVRSAGVMRTSSVRTTTAVRGTTNAGLFLPKDVQPVPRATATTGVHVVLMHGSLLKILTHAVQAYHQRTAVPDVNMMPAFAINLAGRVIRVLVRRVGDNVRRGMMIMGGLVIGVRVFW